MESSKPKPSLSLPFKARLQLQIFNLIVSAACRPNFTVNRRLINLFDRKLPPNPTPIHSVSTHDFTINPSHNLWFRLFIPSAPPETASSLPVIVFFHGGAFLFLSPSSSAYDAVCRRLSRRLSALVVSVSYRLAPEHKFPAQYHDAFEILKFLNDPLRRSSIPAWPENADVTQCFLIGDSAGANIAHHTAVRVSEEPLSELRVIGSVIIQPFFSGKERLESEMRLKGAPVVKVERTDWIMKAFYPDGLGPDHWATNVCGPNAKEVSGLDLAPVMVVVGGFDPLQDWQRRYYWWLKKEGKEVRLVEYPNACHGFYVFPEVPESSPLIDEIKSFMAKHMSKV